MKTKYIISSMLVSCLAAILVSCSESWPYSEDAYNDTWIGVSPRSISLGDEGLSGKFEVRSFGRWYIYDYSWWINIPDYYMSGYGNTDVFFSVDENTGDTRSGYIRVRTDDAFMKEAEIEIQQPQFKFEVTMPQTNYKAAGDYWWLNVTTSSLMSWTISKSDAWVHLAYGSNTSNIYNGRGSQEVTIYVDRNPYSWSRRSSLMVNCGTKWKSITISQDGR